VGPPETTPDIKKRIMRTVLKEIVVTSRVTRCASSCTGTAEITPSLRLKRMLTGRHGHVTNAETIELITSLARLQSDARIAATINRLGHRTAHGQAWTAARVCSIRMGVAFSPTVRASARSAAS